MRQNRPQRSTLLVSLEVIAFAPHIVPDLSIPCHLLSGEGELGLDPQPHFRQQLGLDDMNLVPRVVELRECDP